MIDVNERRHTITHPTHESRSTAIRFSVIGGLQRQQQSAFPTISKSLNYTIYVDENVPVRRQ